MTYVVVAKAEEGHIYFDVVGPFFNRQGAEKFIPRLRGYEAPSVMSDPAGIGRPHDYVVVDRREATDPFDYVQASADDM